MTCYLCGSIPFGLLLSKLLGKGDPRLVGSKNIGATNIVRTSGWKLGLLTLIFDIKEKTLDIMAEKNEKVNALAGTHRDADIISRVAASWGWNMIRGSSKEKGDIACLLYTSDAADE